MGDFEMILITGGCGFIGTNIALKAKKKGYDVIVMDSLVRPKSEENLKILKKKKIEILRGDCRNMVDFYRCPIPDAIIHLAANPGIPWSIRWPSYDFYANTVSTLNVLEFARTMGIQLKKKIPVIFASTNKVYSDLINEIPIKEEKNRYEWRYNKFEGATMKGINEKFPIDGFGEYAHSPYGVSKLAGDLLCQEYYQTYKIPTVINRMSCIYGLYQKGVADQGWVDHFVRKITFGDGKLDIFGNGKQVRDLLWGEDLAELYLKEIENIDKIKGQIFNVGGGKENSLSLLEAIEIIEKLSNKKAILRYHEWRHADQKIYISDISKVTKMLDWKPKIKPEIGLKMMIEFYRRKK